VRIRRRFQKAAVIADNIEDSTNKRPESPKVAVEPTKDTENEDLEDSVHLIVPRRRKVDMSKSKSVMMRSKMESTPAASRHKRSNLPGILNEFSIEHASMLGGRMETPKDDSFEKNKISRVTEPIQLQLDEGVENSSYALFGSECSSSEEKSVEVLVPETPLKPKKIGICNRDSSPLKEIHPNKIISCAKPPASRLPTPIFNSVTITGTPLVQEKSSPVEKSRLTINKLDVGNVSKRPTRTIRKRETHELDETPTIRLSQSPVKPESESRKTIVPPKEVKAKPSRTTMRRRRKTSIGETPGKITSPLVNINSYFRIARKSPVCKRSSFLSQYSRCR